MSDSTVGTRLAAFRHHRKLSQEAMATAIGVSFSAFRTYEGDSRPLRSDHLLRLYEMGLNLNWLLAGSGDMVRPESRSPEGFSEASAPPLGHHDSVPGYCRVRDVDGAETTRVDLIPEVLSPVIEWISAGIAAADGEIDWKWAAERVIGRYEWDFNTWLRTRQTEAQ